MWGRSLILAVIALVTLASFSTDAEARRYRHRQPQQHQQAFTPLFQQFGASEQNIEQPIARGFRRFGRSVRTAFDGGSVIGGRPSGCPRSFCGCGASIYLWGKIRPELNLAANWLRFPRAHAAPRMAAARRGHVFVLVSHISGDTWMVHDSNSGRGKTRLHARSLRGFTIVNPHA